MIKICQPGWYNSPYRKYLYYAVDDTISIFLRFLREYRFCCPVFFNYYPFTSRLLALCCSLLPRPHTTLPAKPFLRASKYSFVNSNGNWGSSYTLNWRLRTIFSSVPQSILPLKMLNKRTCEILLFTSPNQIHFSRRNTCASQQRAQIIDVLFHSKTPANDKYMTPRIANTGRIVHPVFAVLVQQAFEYLL